MRFRLSRLLAIASPSAAQVAGGVTGTPGGVRAGEPGGPRVTVRRGSDDRQRSYGSWTDRSWSDRHAARSDRVRSVLGSSALDRSVLVRLASDPLAFGPALIAEHGFAPSGSTEQDREAERQDREREQEDREAERARAERERESSLYEQGDERRSTRAAGTGRSAIFLGSPT